MDSATCPDVAVSEWSQQLLAHLGGRRCPLNATFELTERCNLNCVHCYINRAAADTAARAAELTLAEAMAILDQMADEGCLSLLLTGGEVLLRPDFPDIYVHAKKRGLLVTIFSNGTLLTPEIVGILAEWPPQQIEISIYGASAQTYERVTRVAGSHTRFRRGIDLALSARLRLGLKAIVLTVNRHELDEMRALAAELDVPFRYDALLWPRPDGNRRPGDYMLSPTEIVALDVDDEERRGRWQQMRRRSDGAAIRAQSVFTCGAARTGYHVGSAGWLSPCMMVRRPSYDLRRMSFRDGWQAMDPLPTRGRTQNTACRTCLAGELCTLCPGWSQMAHGDDETPVDYVCEVGRLRATQFVDTPLLSR